MLTEIEFEKGSITAELTGIGAQCRGERHLQVISRQREAINDLRKRLRQLEEIKPVLEQSNLAQHVMLLKKQLAEVRASQALTEDIAKHANLARGNEEGFLMIEEKTAHYETQTALENSEESYLQTIRSISKALELTDIRNKSMANLPSDEARRLALERSKTTDLICNKIRFLKDLIDQKQKILKEYESDLAKLRQAEFLLEKKTQQLDECQMQLRDRDDEIKFLRESLKNTKSELDKEKLFNASIKQKKNISLSLDRTIKKSVETAKQAGDDTKTPRIKSSRTLRTNDYYDMKQFRNSTPAASSSSNTNKEYFFLTNRSFILK